MLDEFYFSGREEPFLRFRRSRAGVRDYKGPRGRHRNEPPDPLLNPGTEVPTTKTLSLIHILQHHCKK